MADLGWAGMAGAGGAGDAIQQIFAQRMDQARLAQQKNEFDQQQAQQDALTRLKVQEQADAIRQRVEASHQAEVDRAHAKTMLGLALRPIGSDVTPDEMQNETAAGAPSSLYKIQPPQPATLPSTPSIGMGGLSPIGGGPTGAPSLAPMTPTPSPSAPPVPQQITFGGTNAQQEKQTSDALARRKLDEARVPPDPMAVHAANRAFDVAHPLPHDAPTVVVQTVDEKGNPITKIVPKTAGSEFQGRANPQVDRQRKLAEFASGDVSAALDQIDAAEKQGLLGPAAGRLYGQFLAGTIGSTGDAATDARLGGLRAAIKDLNTSYPMAISGNARGGGGALDRLNSVLNSDKFSAELMRGALHEIAGALARRSGSSPSGGSGGFRVVGERPK